MSEEAKKERSSGQIQNEYQNICAKLGHIEYSIERMNKDKEILVSALRDLNLEHQKAKQREAELLAQQQQASSPEGVKSNEQPQG